MTLRWIPGVIGMLLSQPVWAHTPSDAHLHLAIDGDTIAGRLDIAVRDLDGAIALDLDGDGGITWGELTDAAPRIERYVSERLAFAAQGRPCSLTFGAAGLVELSDGPSWAQPLTARCQGAATPVSITYNLLFDVDAQHRGLVHIDARTVIVRDATPLTLAAGQRTSISAFVEEGIWHIWHGFDHLLFLAALILPVIATRSSLRTVAREVLEIVTAFTLAHSITLVIAAPGLVQLPARVVETAIALTVVAAAANNLVRVVDARWVVAFALGLLHGFGFSTVLVELGLPSHELIGALLGFNLGVELGQFAVVVILVPVLFALRRTAVATALLWGGSLAMVAIASVWSYQRFVH